MVPKHVNCRAFVKAYVRAFVKAYVRCCLICYVNRLDLYGWLELHPDPKVRKAALQMKRLDDRLKSVIQVSTDLSCRGWYRSIQI